MTEPVREQNELKWLEQVLGGYVDGPPTQYLCRPSIQQPQLLIPLKPTRVTQASMKRDHDDRSPKERLQSLVAETTARLGILRFAGGEVTELRPFRLVRQLEEELGEPRLLATISLGPRRRNRKPVIQLIRPDGTPVAFVKVGWSPFTRELVSNEAHWLKQVKGKMPTGVAAPEVLARLQDEDIDAVATTPLPVKAGARRTTFIPPAIIRQLAQVAQNEPMPLAELPTVQQWATQPVSELLHLDRLLERHGDVVIQTGLWHGDLTPWNTASSADLMYLWDWEFAGDHRPIGFDSLHETFERSRRAAVQNEQTALDMIVRTASNVLAPFVEPSSGLPGSSGQTASGNEVEAIVDLYLCELISRESRLAGEGWKPKNLGPLDEMAQTMLERRLLS